MHGTNIRSTTLESQNVGFTGLEWKEWREEELIYLSYRSYYFRSLFLTVHMHSELGETY